MLIIHDIFALNIFCSVITHYCRMIYVFYLEGHIVLFCVGTRGAFYLLSLDGYSGCAQISFITQDTGVTYS